MSQAPVLLAQAVREIGKPGFTVVELRKLIEARKVHLFDVGGRRAVKVDDVRLAMSAPSTRPKLKTKPKAAA